MVEFPRSLGPDDVEALSAEEKVKEFFARTVALSEFADKKFCSVVIGQVGMSQQEEAITGKHYRMCLILRGLARIENPCHFQIASMAARAMFELLLDLKARAADSTFAEKFFDFTWGSRYHKARQLVDFLNANLTVDRTYHQHAINLVSKTGVDQNRQQLCAKHGWDPKKPPLHWFGKDTLQRVPDADLGCKEIYRSQFSLQSYYVHAGGAGMDSLSRDAS